MAQELKQSTEYNIKIGPFVDVGDGFTPETAITIDAADEAEILKANTTGTLAISGTLTAIANCDGWYYLTLSSGDTDELGPLTIVIQDDSACLPVHKEFNVVSSNYFDTKYGTDSFRASLASATYTTATTFHASVTGYSTFDPAADSVSLGSATYTTATAFHASVTGYSTFDPSAEGVSLSSAIYTAIADFKATGFSTFDPAASGVSLSSAIYTAIADFKATGFSTFDPAATGVTLASATYTTATAFHASVTGYSTFDPATTAVTITNASVDDIHDEVYEGTETFRQSVKIMRSALAGKSTGGSTTTLNFRDAGDAKNRIQATVDANGNRTAVTTDGT